MNRNRWVVTVRGAILLASTCLASGALAQSLPTVRATLDENGVDLATGTYNLSAASISVGGANGLSWSQGRQDILVASIHKAVNSATSQTELEVVIGAARNVFIQSGSSFAAKEQDGSSLSLSGMTYTYRNAGGDVATFLKVDTSTTIPVGAGNEGLLQQLRLASGQTLDYIYSTIRLAVGQSPGGTIYRNFMRLQTVGSGIYQLHLTYALDTATSTTQVGDWQRRTRLTALSTATDNCPATANSCATTVTWPSIDFATNGTLTDALGRATAITSSATATTIRLPGSSTDDVTVSYANGKVSSLVAGGVTTSYTYPTTGTTTVTRASLPARTYTFNANLQILSESWQPTVGGTVYTRSYAYDPTTALLTRITEPDGNYTKFTYDAFGRLTETRKVAKVAGTPADIVTTSAYDDATCANAVTCFLPNRVTDANAKTTSFAYDPTHGGVTSITRPADANGTSPQTRFTYKQLDANGAVTTSGTWMLTETSACRSGTNCVGTAAETRRTVTYGTGLLPTTVTTAAGDGSASATVTSGYDAVGNLVSMDGPLLGSADVTNFIYDALRRVTGVISPDPDGAGPRMRRARVVHYLPNGLADSVSIGSTDANGGSLSSQQQRVSAFDTNRRKVGDTFSAGGATYGVTQYGYDAVGRLTCTAVRMDPGQWNGQTDACTPQTTGANGPDRVVRSDYDGVGRVISVTSAYGTADASTDATSYNPNGTVKTVTDGNGNVTTSAYDGFDRLLTTTYPGGSYEQLGYDPNGNVTSRLLRDGKSITYGYDALNRLTSVAFINPVDVTDSNRTYSYDLAGGLLQAIDANGHQVNRTYDALGRMISERGGIAVEHGLGSTTYSYDSAGRMKGIVSPGGFAVSYDYLVTGEVSAIRDSGGAALVTFGYDDLGRRTSLTRANGTVTGYAYDPASRLSQLTQDLAGTASDLTVGFGYNPAGQITSRTSSNDAYAWTGTYNVDRSYAVNALNQFTAAGSTALGYDGRGNLTSSGSTTYSYNSDNHMSASSGPTGTTIYYDPLGMVDQIWANNTEFDNNLGRLTTEWVNGSIARRYVYGPGSDEPLIWYEGTGLTDRRWLHADERGSVIAVSNDAGNAIAINTYDEFGIPGANNLGRFQYTGQKWLPELGLYDYKARMYSPTLGRFMQTDPIGYGDGLNWYNYVGSDPVNNTDPSGMFAKDIIVWGRGGGGYPGSLSSLPFLTFNLPNFGGERNDDIIVNGVRPKKKQTPGLLPPVVTPQKVEPICYGPPAGPAGISRADLARQATINGAEAAKHSAANLSWFKSQVGDFGPWDYKRHDPAFENFGNYNYGYVGTAQGINSTVLLQAAGLVQLKNGTSSWSYITSNWDDPRDQEQIRRGIHDRQNNCVQR